MPNWVYNNLNITDSSDEHSNDIARLMEQVGASYTMLQTLWTDGTYNFEPVEVNKDFSFWNIVRPEGEALEQYEESLRPSATHSSWWYDWNCEHWGTKWDASDVEICSHAANHKQINFSTAWAAPLPVLIRLSEQYPNLHFELGWEEEEGFGGTFVFDNGEAIEIDSYDTPDSHAEHAARERTCICEWEDSAENFYPDCPGYVSDKNTISENELEVEAML